MFSEACLICQTSHQLEMVELLLKNDAKINLKDPLTHRTALHIAAFTGNIVLIQLLLLYGANNVVTDVRGDMPYQMALHFKHNEAAKLLHPDDEDNISELK